MAENKKRRSFSQPALEIRKSGVLGGPLAEALVPPEGAAGYLGTHGFHPYPGRFHWHVPQTLLRQLARPGMRVFDPFMGGGTTLVEALRGGFACGGNDLNPVALMVARERTRPRSADAAQALVAAARGIGGEVTALRRAAHPPRVWLEGRRVPAHLYAPHLLAELLQWLGRIEAQADPEQRETLRAVFSSAVVKFSNLESDSQPEEEGGEGQEEGKRESKGDGQLPGREKNPRTHYPKGAVSRFLVSKCEELARAQQRLGADWPPGTPPPQFWGEDARHLPAQADGAWDLLITSPPYPGVYDYHDQHRVRMEWLGLEGGAFQAGELSPRRQAGGGADAAGKGWSAGMRETLATLARITAPGGMLCLVVGDWLSQGHPVDAATQIGRLAGGQGWQQAAIASARRPLFASREKRAFARRGKWEHLILLEREGTGAASGGEPARQAPPRPAPARAGGGSGSRSGSRPGKGAKSSPPARGKTRPAARAKTAGAPAPSAPPADGQDAPKGKPRRIKGPVIKLDL